MVARQQDIDRVYTELLLLAARRGDVKAANLLAARWYPRLAATARRLLGDRDEAAEAVQESWAAICQGWMRLRDPARFPAWAFGILHRKCVDVIRRRQATRARFADPDPMPDPPQKARAEDALCLDEAFAALSLEHRIAADFHFRQGLTLREVAEATGVPPGTAKSRIHYARQQLRAHLEGDYP